MAKFEPDEYRHEGNAVSLLHYHFVFIPKRRKKVLIGAVAERLQQIICELVVENRWKIIAMEIMLDHVHLFLNVKTTDDPAGIMRKIKGRASHHSRAEFPELKKLPYRHQAILSRQQVIFAPLPSNTILSSKNYKRQDKSCG